MEETDILQPSIWWAEKDTTSPLWYSYQKVWSESHYEEIEKSKLKVILQSNWPVFLKNVNIMKNKTGGLFSMKRFYRVGPLNVMHDPELNSRLKKSYNKGPLLV